MNALTSPFLSLSLSWWPLSQSFHPLTRLGLCFRATGKPLRAIGSTLKGEEAGNADELVKFLAKNHKGEGRPLLFLKGDKSREVIPLFFKERGEPLTELEVYRSEKISCPAISLGGEREATCLSLPLWAVFFSPSGVSTALEKVKDLPWAFIRVAAIGGTSIEPRSSCQRLSLSLSLTGE